jgi:hypothetical protein
VISNLVLNTSCKKSAQALFVFLLLTCLRPAYGKEQANVWHLRYIGQQSALRDVFIAPNAIKIVNSSTNTVLSKAPKWDACVFNDKSKMILRIPFAKWQKAGLGIFEAEVEPIAPNQLVNDQARVLGLPAVQYQSKSMVTDGYFRMRGAPREATNRFFGTNAISVSEVQKKLFCFWFGIPLTKEFPLIWSQSYANGETSYDLKILSIAQEPYNARAFQEPVNYTSAHDTREVYMRTLPNAVKGILEEENTDPKRHPSSKSGF